MPPITYLWNSGTSTSSWSPSYKTAQFYLVEIKIHTDVGSFYKLIIVNGIRLMKTRPPKC